MVTFTGSAKVGWHIKAMAGRKKVALELGGNGAVIVAEDADLDLAAARCVRGGVVYGGQYCIGVQRILVHADLYDTLRGKGFGLGLHYVQQIALAHGGGVSVRSELGKGSVFTLSLPLNQSA